MVQETRLSVTNPGPVALPFGLSVHPWFPRYAMGCFCFELFCHPVDAHDLPGQPGLTAPTRGVSLTVFMTLTSRIDQ